MDAKEVVEAIIDDITGRQGGDEFFHEVDDETIQEIRDTWQAIVEKGYAALSRETARADAAEGKLAAFLAAGHAEDCGGSGPDGCACGWIQREGAHRYITALQDDLTYAHKRADAAEARERKLREALERCVREATSPDRRGDEESWDHDIHKPYHFVQEALSTPSTGDGGRQ